MAACLLGGPVPGPSFCAHTLTDVGYWHMLMKQLSLNVICYTCTFPSITPKCLGCEKDLWPLKTNTGALWNCKPVCSYHGRQSRAHDRKTYQNIEV